MHLFCDSVEILPFPARCLATVNPGDDEDDDDDEDGDGDKGKDGGNIDPDDDEGPDDDDDDDDDEAPLWADKVAVLRAAWPPVGMLRRTNSDSSGAFASDCAANHEPRTHPDAEASY